MKKSIESFNFFGAEYASAKGGAPEIRCSLGGKITFNANAAQLLEMKEGDKWALVQDKVKPMDWYLARHESGISLRNDGKTTCKAIQARNIVKFMAQSLNINGDTKSFSMPVAVPVTDEIDIIEGIRFYPLITRNVKKY